MAKKDFVEKQSPVVEQLTMTAAPTNKFNFIFQVVNPFLNYRKGALITNDDAIQDVFDNGYAKNCNRLPRK